MTITNEKPKFCTARLHYIGKDDKVCACGQLVSMDELYKFSLHVRNEAVIAKAEGTKGDAA